MSVMHRVYTSQFVRGSILMFVASNMVNFGNFLYNTFMARLLGPKEYGALGGLISVLVFTGIPLMVVNFFVTKLVSSYSGQGKLGDIKSNLVYLTPRLLLMGTGGAVLLVLTAPSLVKFLNVEQIMPLVILSSGYILTVSLTANRAFLSGMLAFPYLTINSLTEVLLKLAVSIALVSFNFHLLGAVTGPFIGGIGAYILSIIQLKYLLRNQDIRLRKSSLDFKPENIFPPIIVTLILTIFINLDIIFVNHFLPAAEAGQYVALSTMNKIIYYLVGPILTVMFPLVSSRTSKGIPYIVPFVSTLLISLTVGFLVRSAYLLFPKFIVDIMFGSQYHAIIPLIGRFSYFIIIFTLNAILTQFLLSISYYKPIYLLFLITLLQGILLWFYHDSANQIITVNIIVSVLYFAAASFFILRKEFKDIIRMLPKILPNDIYGR